MHRCPFIQASIVHWIRYFPWPWPVRPVPMLQIWSTLQVWCRKNVWRLLLAFDVISLFTNIPIDEAVMSYTGSQQLEKTILWWGWGPHYYHWRIAELLQLCLKSMAPASVTTVGSMKRNGVAIVSPISAIVASLYMEFFEELNVKEALHI